MSTIINGTSDAITFPDSTIQNTSAIVSGKVPYTNLPAGSVLQVVNATTSTPASTTSTSFVSTALAATITPKFSTSKILIIVNGVGWATASTYASYTIARSGTPLGGSNGLTRFWNNDGAVPLSMSYLDSPATTSPVAYTVYYKRGSSGTAYFTDSNDTSVITLMEIAA